MILKYTDRFPPHFFSLSSVSMSQISISLWAAILKKRSIPLPSIRTFTLPSRISFNLFKPDHLQAAFLNSLPEEEIRKMADTYTDGYIRGFEVMGRDLAKKKTAAIRYPVGMERMVRQAVKNFEAAGLSVIFPRGAVGSINRNPAGRGGYTSVFPE